MTQSSSLEPSASTTGVPPRGPRWQATHARILAATEKLFSENGYAVVTIEEVIQAADTTRATFYKHFAGKGAVVEELILVEREKLEPLWQPLHDLPTEPSLEQLQQWARGAADKWIRHAVRMRIFEEASHADPRVALRAQFIAEDTGARIQRALAHLAWQDEGHARVECLLIAAQMRQVFSYWTSTPPAERDPRILDAFADNWHRALVRGRGLK
jgi:AcrR family transcriptional regulator